MEALEKKRWFHTDTLFEEIKAWHNKRGNVNLLLNQGFNFEWDNKTQNWKGWKKMTGR